MPRRRRAAARRAPAKKPRNGVRSGALNVNHKNSPRKQQVEDLRRAMARADIVSLSEVRRGSALIKWARRNGYGVYVAKGTGADNAIIWDRREVRLVRNPKSISLNDLEGKRGGARERFAAYGLFQDLQTGNQFWQVAAHTVNLGRGDSGLNSRIMDEQYGTLAKLARQLSRTAPVLLAGDLNYKHPEIANLSSDMSGKGIMHVMAGDGFDVKRTRAIGGLNTDKRFVFSVLNFDGKHKPGVAQPPKVPPPAKPAPVPDPAFDKLPKIGQPPKFDAFWEGDMGGGPVQVAPGAPPKGATPGWDIPKPDPTRLDYVDLDWGSLDLLPKRQPIDFDTAEELVLKSSSGFFIDNDW